MTHWRSIPAALVTLFSMSQAANAQDKVAFGQYLSGECVTCHQLTGADNGIPPIVGWDVESFAAVMNAYKNKELENKVMVTIAGALSDDDIAALGAYFATIEPVE